MTLTPWSVSLLLSHQRTLHAQECKEFSTHHVFARDVLSTKNALANPFATSQHSLLLWDVGSEVDPTSQIQFLPLPSHNLLLSVLLLSTYLILSLSVKVKFSTLHLHCTGLPSHTAVQSVC